MSRKKSKKIIQSELKPRNRLLEKAAEGEISLRGSAHKTKADYTRKIKHKNQKNVTDQEI